MSNQVIKLILAGLCIALVAHQVDIYFISKRLDILAESVDLLATRQKLERKTQYGQWQ